MGVELPPSSFADRAGVICIVDFSSTWYSWGLIETTIQALAILAIWHTFKVSKCLKAPFLAKYIYGMLTNLAMYHVSTVYVATLIDYTFMFSRFHIRSFFFSMFNLNLPFTSEMSICSNPARKARRGFASRRTHSLRSLVLRLLDGFRTVDWKQIKEEMAYLQIFHYQHSSV